MSEWPVLRGGCSAGVGGHGYQSVMDGELTIFLWLVFDGFVVMREMV